MQTATISKTEIELLIEQKLIEILGDPDSGLKFTTSFVQKIKERLKKPIHTDTPQERKESSDLEDEHNKDVLSQP